MLTLSFQSMNVVTDPKACAISGCQRLPQPSNYFIFLCACKTRKIALIMNALLQRGKRKTSEENFHLKIPGTVNAFFLNPFNLNDDTVISDRLRHANRDRKKR